MMRGLQNCAHVIAAAKSLKMPSALKHCFQQIQPAAPDAR